MKTMIAGTIATLLLAGTALAGQHGHGAKIDTDGDGAFSLAEMQAAAEARFAKVDANADGYVSAQEREETHARMKAKMRERIAEKRGQEAAERFDERAQEWEGKRKGRGGEGFMARLDENDDGFVSLEETRARTAERFSKMDADGDGLVTREEMRAARPHRGKRD
ncbi:hypothetical protein [Parvularcula dongshanensis]|uniref:EF-hand domain-containing protein n=1 Tax=Parvularcula dongshanensis TaxID=1173995 RepID=A0A840I3J5_9PROT|nr:hypothetical protein [Parvularcula dongshanensis]MBB4658851.1 hypothetical protein [Parvularcula dongshanensis]